jgi:hypothetical protein
MMKLGYIYMFGRLKKSAVNVRISLQLGLVEMAQWFTLPHASFDLGNGTRNNKKENERQTWVTFHGISFCYSLNTIRKNLPRGNLNKGSSLVKFPFLFFPSLFPFRI